MPRTDRHETNGAAAAGDGTSLVDSSWTTQISALWREPLGLVLDQLTLAALEAKLVGRRVLIIFVAGLMMAILIITAWLALMGSVMLWLVEVGIATSVAMLFVVAANLLCAMLLFALITRHGKLLSFPATLRSLRDPRETRGHPEGV